MLNQINKPTGNAFARFARLFTLLMLAIGLVLSSPALASATSYPRGGKAKRVSSAKEPLQLILNGRQNFQYRSNKRLPSIISDKKLGVNKKRANRRQIVKRIKKRRPGRGKPVPRPSKPPVNPIPEPGAAMVFGLGIAVASSQIRKHKKK